MQKKVKLRLAETFFVLLCFCCSAFSVYQFWKCLNAALTKNEEPIATITFKYKTAQRKFLDDLLWDRLRQNSPVYEGDTIRTADLAEATIYFSDGNVMDLQENTMARISLKDGAEADISSGKVTVRTSQKSSARIKSGDSVVEVSSGTNLTAGGAENGQISVAVQSGSAALQSSSGVSVNLEAGQVTEVSSSGEFIQRNLIVNEPSENQRVLNFTTDDYPINFDWKGDSNKITIQVALDKSFNNVVYNQLFENVENAEVKLPSGTYYWRMTGEQNEEVDGKLSILYSPAPNLIAPKKNFSINYRTKLPSVRFAWSDVERATSYEFVVADNKEMNNPIIKQRSSTTSIIVNTLEAGTYYRNVTPYYVMNGIGLALPSETNSFKIVQNGELEAPNLILPSDNALVSTKIPLKDGTNAYKKVNFSWQNDDEAKNYDLKIWQEGSNGIPLVGTTVTTNYFTLDTSLFNVKNGTWYWQVTINDNEGNYKNSEIRSFYAMDTNAEQRTLFPPDGYRISESRTQDLTYNWKSNVPADTVFQVANDKLFRDIVFTQTLNAQTMSANGRNLHIGNYYWRITSKIGDVELTTTPKLLVVEPPLEAPEMVTPYENSRAVIRPNTPYEFKWKTVEGADYYQLRLAKIENPDEYVFDQNFVESKDGKNVSLMVDMEDLEEGNYIWTLQAYREESNLSSRANSYVANRQFNMKKLKPITLVYPKDGASYNGIENIKKPDSFVWNSVDKAKNTKILIYKDKVTKANLVNTIVNSESKVKMPRLYGGTYYWRVEGYTEDDLDITSAEIRRFLVSPIPKLGSPKMIAPAEKTVYGAEYFKENKQITFNWSAVSGADRYLFTLKTKKGEVLVEEFLDKNITNYVLDDLSKLKITTLIWTVEAQSLYEGELLQQGEITPTKFDIDLPKPNKVQVKDKGKRYGK